MKNYVAYHVHTELSLLDSCTQYQQYIDKAVALGQRAIAFTEHGNIYQWVAKKIACDTAGLKYIHGIECYLTQDSTSEGTQKQRDNYHTVLLAKNYNGVLELNEVVSRSSRPDHFYYDPRITFDEFFAMSDNIIKISACLASPLNRIPTNIPLYEKLVKHYDYLEIQPHDYPEQVAYNRQLAALSDRYHIPLIAGTDTHSIDSYKAECRSVLKLGKHIVYADEDSFDLTYHSYDELVELFRKQDAIPESYFLSAIQATNDMADSIEDFELDTSYKYPILYGERDKEVFENTIADNFREKQASGAISPEQVDNFKAAIKEECRVFDKIQMSGFMLFMSELVTWCKSNGIPIGFNRGSVGGSRVAYITNTIDLNPETWHTVFSRFANEDRKEIGDIDIDVSPSDRDKVYEYIINRFGQTKTAYILAIGTIKDKGCIDEICRALSLRWEREHLHDLSELKRKLKELRIEEEFPDERSGIVNIPYYVDAASKRLLNPDDILVDARTLTDELNRLRKENEELQKQNPYGNKLNLKIKDDYDADPESARKRYPDVFYYFDGLIGTAISQSMHPAGIVASPITLRDHYGTFLSDGKEILQIDMDCVHEVSLVKYDILALKNLEILKDAYNMLGVPFPKSHEIDWFDEAVWKDMLKSPAGIFQFEGDYAFTILKQYQPHSLFDMSLITAALRPSGASYRDELIQHKPHKNPSKIIDDLLKDNLGYLIYQEDTIKFLQQICGLSGSEADNIRRAIGRKDEERLKKALPKILDGYCDKSPRPRNIAEAEAKEFLQIIEDSASYQFG